MCGGPCHSNASQSLPSNSALSPPAAVRSKPNTCSRFDFPEPFGPMSTFSGSRGRSMPSGPKDSSPCTRNRSISMMTPSVTLPVVSECIRIPFYQRHHFSNPIYTRKSHASTAGVALSDFWKYRVCGGLPTIAKKGSGRWSEIGNVTKCPRIGGVRAAARPARSYSVAQGTLLIPPASRRSLK